MNKLLLAGLEEPNEFSKDHILWHALQHATLVDQVIVGQ